jgi:hypothetical protein
MTSGFEDHYRTLQVDPAADPEVIEAAYRALARKYHPDRNPRPEAQADMARLNHAHEVLRNPVARAAFDAERGRVRIRVPVPGPVPAPTYEPEVRRAPPPPGADAGRGVSMFLIFPLFLLAGAALVLLILFGPLGSSDIERAAGSVGDGTGSPATRIARTAQPSLTPAPTSQPSMQALRNSLLRSRKEAVVDEITGDVTGDGVAELLILTRPIGCDAACTKRSIIVINADNRYWPISNVDNAVLQNISLADPGFEIFQALKLGDEEACCPSTGRATFYRWTGQDFSVNGVYFEALGTNDLTPEEAVRRFYESVGKSGLLRSYAMTSRAYQDRHPFESWASGFSTTTAVKVQTLEQQGTDVVAVDVVATDSAAGGKQQRFKGTWRLVDTRFGWRLDEGAIEPQP